LALLGFQGIQEQSSENDVGVVERISSFPNLISVGSYRIGFLLILFLFCNL
jgi:hypothetical protein